MNPDTTSSTQNQKTVLSGLFYQIAMQTSHAVVVTDLQKRITWTNPGFERLSGYTTDEVLGKRPGEFLQGPLTDTHTRQHMRSQLSNGRSFDVEVVNYHRAGHLYWVRIHCEPLLGDDGKQIGFVSIQTDITAEKKAYDKLLNVYQLNHAILKTMRDAVVTADLTGVIQSVNPAFERIFGYSETEILDRKVTELMPEIIAGKHDGYMSNYIAHNTDDRQDVGHRRLVTAVRKNGEHFPLEVSLSRVTVNNESKFVAILSDLSQEEEAKAGLEQFKRTLDYTLDCVFMFDANTLKFIYVNQGAIDQLGYTRQELLELHPYDIKPLFSRRNFMMMIGPLLRGEVPQLNFQTIHRTKQGEDTQVEVFLQYVALDRDDARFIAIVRDITQQQNQKDAIQQLAYYDPLTGLPNRRFIRNRLDSASTRAAITGQYGAVLLSDLDEFKSINDTLGHTVGDELLVEMATRFKAPLDSQSSLARLGGDEFLIVIDRLSKDREEAEQKLEALMAQIVESAAKPSRALGGNRSISTSMGGVLFNDASVSVSELMRLADIAMYDAKRRGKNCFSLFNEEMQRKLLEDETLAVDLKLALDEGIQIQPWFQPKVDAEGRWCGFEALVRWNHPEMGLIPPDRFIELAERKNLMLQLGRVVLEKSCNTLVRLRGRFQIDHLTLAVNISQSQLAMTDFPNEVEAALQQSGLPPECLQLEVTESMVAEDLQQSIERMERLRALGVSFSLDDFGTGYSSLSYLRQLPIDELKVDRSFVQDIAVDPQDAAIVRTIIQLAESLNLSVVAEGVEDGEQAKLLTELKCDLYQGYHFSKPLPESELEAALELQFIGSQPAQ